MDEISNDLLQLNNYFESALAMIPHYNQMDADGGKHRKRSRDSHSDIRTGPKAKWSKVNSHMSKAMNTFNQQSTETDDNDDESNNLLENKNKKSLINKDANCTLEELQERLQKKLEELRKQREPKLPRKRGRRKKKDKNISQSLEKQSENSDHEVNKNVLSSTENAQTNSDKLVTKEGKVVFSKFDFSQMVGKYSNNKSMKKNKLPSGKNYELLLLKAAREKEKVEKLKKEDPKKASDMIEKSSWEKALARAEGEKIKDDPALLKKSLKRKLAKTKKSKKEWKARTEQLEDNMRKRQEKKQRNVQKRKEHNQNRKAFKRAKKMPGF